MLCQEMTRSHQKSQRSNQKSQRSNQKSQRRAGQSVDSDDLLFPLTTRYTGDLLLPYIKSVWNTQLQHYKIIYLFDSLQSSPTEHPIPITTASIIHLLPIEQWDPIVKGMNFSSSLCMLHGRRVVFSPIKVYFWICIGAKSARITTPGAIKHRPRGISRADGRWMVASLLIIFLVEVSI